MRFVHRLVCAALLTLSASPLFAQNAGNPARVSGTVVDTEGKAVRGATITFETVDEATRNITTTTDERGRFSVPGLRSGRWRFTVLAPGFDVTTGETTFKAGGNPAMTPVLRVNGTMPGSLSHLQVRDLQADLSTADALFEQQRWNEAIAFYRSILVKAPVLTNIHLQLGAAYRRKGDQAAAIGAYHELLKTEPENEKAIVGIAFAKAEAGDRQAARDLLTKAAAEGGPRREILYGLGELSFEDGSFDAAIGWYRKAAEADVAWGKPLYKLGLSAAKKGESTMARDFLARAAAVDPTSPEAALAQEAASQLAR